MIVTKYLGPTNHKGERVKATVARGISITIPWDRSLSIEGNHRAAFYALCKKLSWTGHGYKFRQAWLPGNNGMAFVIEDKNNRVEV